ncbi:MAG: hypothetical protein ACAI43_13010 [Phycisphaerae bacterium]
MRKGDFAFCVVVDGNILPERPDARSDRTWVVAEKGKEFSLLLVNASRGRVAVVPEIDGVSAIHGRPVTVEDAPSYVIAPRSRFLVPGWRIDAHSVATFLFGAAPDGYARALGAPRGHVGFITAAFFREKPPEPVVDDGPRYSIRSSGGRDVLFQSAPRRPAVHDAVSAPAPPTATGSRAVDEGTDNVAVAFGRRARHQVRTASRFVRANAGVPDAEFSIGYDTARAFQGIPEGCPIPPGWSG